MRSAFPVVVIAAVAVLAPGACAAAGPSFPLAGPVTHIRSGDTIEVDKVPVRLHGIHAQAPTERFGRAAKRFLVELIYGETVRCDSAPAAEDARTGGICYLGARDIAAAVVEAGLARDCPRRSGGRYAAMELRMARARIKLPDACR